MSGAGRASVLTTARRLLLEDVAIQVVTALRAAGVPSLLLKGESTAGLLYDDAEVRVTRDVDLLVQDPEAAAEVARGLGFLPVIPGAHPHELSPHATTWARGTGLGRVELDLHTSFHGVGISPADLWQAWSEDAVEMRLGRDVVPVLAPLDRLLVVAIHASRSTGGAAVQDLQRALASTATETWAAVAARAGQLECVEAFKSGLLTSSRGRDLLVQLGIAPTLSRDEAVRLQGTAAVGLQQILRQRSFARAWEELWPSRGFLLHQHPYAARGRVLTAVARVHRMLVLALRLPGAVRGLRRRAGRQVPPPGARGPGAG